ncbi:MAG: response regulator transcription factor [Bacteroidales bacterium]|nr:response regulator transcription factor [Bacteroidales bacterium]
MNKSMKKQILLVEDDPNLSSVLSDYLTMHNYDITLAYDGEAGWTEYKQKTFDLCILDIMLPKKDGFALAKEIREIDKNIPIIFLTAKGMKEDRIKGFQTGCDDYITKPFSSEELGYRIEAILRRCEMPPPSEDKQYIYSLGNVRFDPSNLRLYTSSGEKNLTPKEAALLKLLFEHQNNLLPREKALKEIWGDDDYFIGRSMDVFISKLRKYLKDEPSISIVNVHGAGFKLEIEGEINDYSASAESSR